MTVLIGIVSTSFILTGSLVLITTIFALFSGEAKSFGAIVLCAVLACIVLSLGLWMLPSSFGSQILPREVSQAYK